MWCFHELLHRKILRNYPGLIKAVRDEFRELELSLLKKIQQAKSDTEIEIITKESIQKHRQIITKHVEGQPQLDAKSSTGWLFNRYWNRINRQAMIPL